MREGCLQESAPSPPCGSRGIEKRGPSRQDQLSISHLAARFKAAILSPVSYQRTKTETKNNLKKKGEMDLGDHPASCPSCDDLVTIHRPVPFWAGAFYANGCVGRQWAPCCALGRTLSRYWVKYLGSLFLSLSLTYLGCVFGSLVAHVLRRR